MRALKSFFILIVGTLFFAALAQYKPADTHARLKEIEDSDAPVEQKLQQAVLLRKNLDKTSPQHDSVYARLLHRIALYKFFTDKNYDEIINLTQQAVRINLSGAINACPSFAINSFSNLGFYYNSLPNPDYNKALSYFDSSLLLFAKYGGNLKFFFESHIERCSIFYNQGSFQEAFDEAIIGLSLTGEKFYTHKTGSLYYQAALAAIALKEYNKGLQLIDKAEDYYSQAADSSLMNAMKQVLESAKCMQARGQALAGMNKKAEAVPYFVKADALTQQLLDPEDVSSLQIEAGSFYVDVMNDVAVATNYFKKAINTCKGGGCTKSNIAAAYNNLGLTAFKQQQLKVALDWYNIAITTAFEKYAPEDFLQNASLQAVRLLSEKKVLFTAVANKAEILMLNYKQNGQPSFLKAAYQTFMLGDSMITDMRYSQTTDGSKLFWRKTTRSFYQQALETAGLLNDAGAVFYFMERSRAALLNDRLNELGANNVLPPVEAAEEQKLRLSVMQKQIQFSGFAENDTGYAAAQQAVLVAQDRLVRFLKKLEEKYPAYYQYKYATEVPSLPQLQLYLQKTNRQFIQYFVGDTCIYILHVNGSKTNILYRSVKNMQDSIAAFLHACSSKDAQNKSYSSFLQLSNRIYNGLFPPHNDSQPNSLIISPDHLLIPFDAFCTDTATGKMLLQDFAISYTYSARFLLKPPLTAENATGNFLGMAPAAFPAAMQLAPLPSSKQALQQLKEMYPGAELMTGEKATRKSLLQNMGAYTIVNLYTHARADSNSAEPQLFLADSAIRLSEFQLIQHPATQLVVLSACQTNTGKLASGEGVYSIARGLAMAGIPSAVATIWKADEAATYFITTAFHKNLSNGMPKDKALQQAKLSWLQQHGREQALPYYWANSTLMGNADAITLKPVAKTPYGWLATGAIALILVGVIAWRVRKAKSKSTSSH